MTYLEYANWVPLPAPVSTTGPLSNGGYSFTAPDGEVYVAKSGVNGGNWSKARDVLFAQATISSALTGNTGQTTIVWDTVARDVYGMWNGTSGLVAPIAGLYRYVTQATCGFGATTGTMAIWGVMAGGTIFFNTQTGTGGFGGWSVTPFGSKDAYAANPGTVFTTQFRQSAANNLNTGTGLTYATLTYVGTG